MARAKPPLRRLLWVDDDSPDRFILEDELLRDAGWHVGWATTLADAVHALSWDAWDAVFLDQMIPFFTGPEFPVPSGGALVLFWLRGRALPEDVAQMPVFAARPLEQNRRCPVVIVSSYYNTDLMEDMRRASPLDAALPVLAKPLHDAALASLLRKLT